MNSYISYILTGILVYLFFYTFMNSYTEKFQNCPSANITTNDPNISVINNRINLMNSEVSSANKTLIEINKKVEDIKKNVIEFNNRSKAYEEKANRMKDDISKETRRNHKNQVENKKLTNRLEMFENIETNMNRLNKLGIY